ncbi:MAG: caspase family protein [Immundisolibacter sp.]|uniref:caspase family protein n=1 Tax=Immundisolibacter sp. TaxID=1934948 RepID=UPI003D0CC752
MSKTALCIGINNYPGTHMDLQGCVNDAADWSQVLTARGFAVTTLLDATATKAAMVTAMSALIAGGVAGDSLVITFSGHGTYQPDADGDEADGLDEALCPHDIQTRGEALVDDEIRAIFAARKPGVRVLLIADSCHSGTVSRAAPAEPEADAPRPRFLPMGNWLPAARVTPVSVVPGAVSPFAGVLLKQHGDLLLSGCKEGPNNYSYDAKIAGRYNGAFTYYALKTLKSLPAGATYADWHAAIGAYLPSASYPQSPRILGSSAARRQPVFA